MIEVLVSLIAVILVIGLVLYEREARRRSAETEMMRTALYAIANIRYELRRGDPLPVTFDKETKAAIKRLQSTAVDIQGMIELASRYLVATLPPEVIENMKVPEEWAKLHQNS